jgi:hypothetical protein
MIVKIGSVSSGTLRPEDLIPCFLDEVKRYGIEHPDFEDMRKRCRSKNYFKTEDAALDLELLICLLDAMAPPYVYFGAHPGDGSDFGFWVDWDMVDGAIEHGEIETDINTSKKNCLILHNSVLYEKRGNKLQPLYEI